MVRCSSTQHAVLCTINSGDVSPIGNSLHTLGVPKTGQSGNTSTCIETTHDIFFSDAATVIKGILYIDPDINRMRARWRYNIS